MTVTEARDKFANLMRVHRDEVMALVDLVPQAPAAATGRVGSQAASAALDEMEMFARKDGRVITETEAPLEARVLGYFSEVGMGDVKRGDEKPWSAAFISHCFREAGAALPTLPVNSANHAAYIHQALAARKAGQNDAPIVYFDQGELAPRIGDLVGFSRDENVRDRDDIEKLNGAFFPSHTDLVLDVGPGTIRVIGGNKSQTIKTVSIRRDENGHMVSDKYFFVLRVNA